MSFFRRIRSVFGTAARAVRQRDRAPLDYLVWRLRYARLSFRDRAAIRAHVRALASRPKLALVMATAGAVVPRFRRAVDSVCAQLYPHWELWLELGPETPAPVRALAEAYAAREPRVRLCDAHPLARLDAELVGVFGCDDTLDAHALYLAAVALGEHPRAEMITTDEDRIDDDGSLRDPWFKPQFSPDFLRSRDYLGRLALFRVQRLRELGGGAAGYDLALRYTEGLSPEQIVHVPFAVYHARAPDEGRGELAREAVRRHVARRGEGAEVLPGAEDFHRVRFGPPTPRPLVSVIIGTRDRASLMRTVCRGVLDETTYRELELIVVDNGSRDPETLEFLAELPRRDPRARVLRHDAPFNFSEIQNLGVRAARGSLVALLNNDLEVIAPDWLTEMVGHAVRPEVGIVGARLLYAEGPVQHAGVIVGIGGVAGHLEKKLPRDAFGYLGRPNLVHNLSAVTGACVVLRKAVYEEVGGFDEKNLAVAFNDVDFCLRIRARGYWVVYAPAAELYHLESISRGPDTTKEAAPRFRREVEYMQRRWAGALSSDPFYSPNLILEREAFALASPPRVTRPWRGRRS